MTLLRRAFFGVAAVAFFVLVSIQFARIVNENLAMARSLSEARQDIDTLRERRREQARELRRLLDPEGAVPAIHEQLHLTRPNEAIIYLKATPPRHE